MRELAVLAAPSTVIVIDPLDGDGRIDGRLRELLAATPTLPVVAVIPLEPEYTGTVRELLAM
ncbi:MAG: hypothetical protein JO306_10885, partial [Gemmatimonadetes bacterium]|nr:hypothetical protein [Gemmatimonadota bacterium]